MKWLEEIKEKLNSKFDVTKAWKVFITFKGPATWHNGLRTSTVLYSGPREDVEKLTESLELAVSALERIDGPELMGHAEAMAYSARMALKKLDSGEL